VRRLGTADAVLLGLGSMLGAGVFAAFSPAAQAAGTGLLVGLAIAAVVAYCNATASAQLAAQYPTSGGTYVYGREQLGEWWGFLAGWAFVVGKVASCAAMALTFAAYLVPADWLRPVAVAAVVALAAVNYRGVTRTAGVTRVLVTVVLLVLAVVVAAGLIGGAPSVAGLSFGAGAGDWYGVLQAGGLLFFAFAGYARIATMGEEVRDPQRTIPRAIQLALAIAVTIYAAVAVACLAALGPHGLAVSSAPLAAAVQAGGWGWAVPVVQVGGAAASLGALLALIAGVGRTSLAMPRRQRRGVHADAGAPQVPAVVAGAGGSGVPRARGDTAAAVGAGRACRDHGRDRVPGMARARRVACVGRLTHGVACPGCAGARGSRAERAADADRWT
jgi:basic amino acid/polyamine antiporter, APA family